MTDRTTQCLLKISKVTYNADTDCFYFSTYTDNGGVGMKIKIGVDREPKVSVLNSKLFTAYDKKVLGNLIKACWGDSPLDTCSKFMRFRDIYLEAF